MSAHDYFVYIMGNDIPTLYIGVTNDLRRRIWEYQNNVSRGSFVEKYKCYKLLYFEHFTVVNEAIAREKQLKRWHRDWKLNLIKLNNPGFSDLALNYDWDAEINSA